MILPASKPLRLLLRVVVGLGLAGTVAAATDLQRSWPNWRGPLDSGVAPFADPPIQWSETNHVRWRIPLPGRGHSSPITAGDRLYVMSASPTGEAQAPVFDQAPGVHDSIPVTHRHQYAVTAVNRADGRILWNRVVAEEWPHEGGHTTGSPVSGSPVTDGTRIFALFGSRGLYSLDTSGAVLWKTNFGRMRTLHAHGEGSSPVLAGDSLFVNWDHEGESFLYALNPQDGSLRWKVARDEKTSWSTPLIVHRGDQRQLVVSATRRVRGYDPASGRVIWECAGLTDNVVSSPVQWQDLVIAGNSYYQQAMMAVRWTTATGDVTGSTNEAWRIQRMTPYVSSPLVYGDTLYFLRHNQNVLSRLDPATGRPRGDPLRLDAIGDMIFSSPVAAAGRLYVTGRDGVTVVLSLDPGNKLLAVNRLEDSFSATPALADGDLYLRGERFLYCLSGR